MTTTCAAKQILIVDDDAPTRVGLTLVMEAAGHAVRTAANGLEALKEVRACRPDLILLDLVMPVMDGWTFRTEQMVDARLADIPVVVLSAGADEARHEAALLGMPNCFRKAGTGHEVLDLVGDLFDVLDQSGEA